MNKRLIAVGILAFLFALPSFATFVGKVNVQKILVTVKEGKKVQSQLKKEFEVKQKELKAEEEKIRKMQEDFKKQSLVMNDKAKVKKQQEMQESFMKLQKKTMAYQKEIQDLEAKLKKPILEKIRGVIQDISKKENVDFTYEVSAAPLVYTKKEVDLTDNVIKAYNKKFK